jgi:hypothetical protein
MFVLIGFASVAAHASATRHSGQEWIDSVDRMVDQIRATHPEPFAKRGRLEFLRSVEDFKHHLAEFSEEEKMVRAMQIVASLGDGHTQLQPDRSDFGFWYPIRVVEFPDGYFVTSALDKYRKFAGARVLKVANRPIAEVAAAARSLVGADNPFGARWNLGSLHNAALMNGLGFAGADYSLSITVKLDNGRIVTESLPALMADDQRYGQGFSRNDWEDSAETLGPPLASPEQWITAYNGEPGSAFRVRDDRHPVHLTLRRALVGRNVPQANTYYIQSNIVEDAADESFRHFFFRVVDEVSIAHSKNIILDLRNNPGGDGSRIQELIPLFSSHLGPEQNLYILTGPKTFSAAILWLGDFRRFLHPTIVGEPAGAALNSFGDAHEYPFPVIGVTAHISTLRNVKSDVLDLSRNTPVDVAAPMTFADWRAGRDPAVDAIVNGKEMRSLSQVALTDGGEAARAAMQERRTAFAKYPWYEPPAEIDLRSAAQILTEEGRYEDAIAIGEIATEFHPGIWNSWYNLAKSQFAAGRLVESQANFRKVLDVDPNNFNKDEIADFLVLDPSKVFSVPAILRWGTSYETIRSTVGISCSDESVAPSKQPAKDSGQNWRMLACDSFNYWGSSRNISFAFVDNRLVAAEIDISTSDSSVVSQAVARDLKEKSISRSGFQEFPNHGVFWSADTGKLLFCSPNFRKRTQIPFP